MGVEHDVEGADARDLWSLVNDIVTSVFLHDVINATDGTAEDDVVSNKLTACGLAELARLKLGTKPRLYLTSPGRVIRCVSVKRKEALHGERRLKVLCLKIV